MTTILRFQRCHPLFQILRGALLLILFVVLTIWSPESRSEATMSAKTDFCIQTYNAFGPIYAPPSWLRFRLLGQRLRSDACDVINLQEVWRDSQFEILENSLKQWPSLYRGIKFSERVKASTQPTTQESDDEPPRYDGLATFSSVNPTHIAHYIYPVNFEITTSPLGALELIRQKVGAKKSVGVTVLPIVDQQKVVFMNTHLHPHSPEVRVAQVIYLLKIIDSYTDLGLPIVLTGDFNAEPDSLEMQLLRYVGTAEDTLKWSKECTYCLSNPNYIGIDFKNKRMDYILAIPSESVSLKLNSSSINIKRVGPLYPSDHFGVQANLSVVQKRASPRYLGVVAKERAQALELLTQALDILRDRVNEPGYREVERIAFDLYTRLKNPDDADGLFRRFRSATRQIAQ